jgi:hypothetical protein
MSAPLVNKRNLDRYIGQRVRLFGKYLPSANMTNDGFVNVMSTDGVEVKCRLSPGMSKPMDVGNGSARVVVTTGRVEADGSITCDSPFAELGTDMDMNLMDEAINLQFRKEFAHLFYSPATQTSYA